MRISLWLAAVVAETSLKECWRDIPERDAEKMRLRERAAPSVLADDGSLVHAVYWGADESHETRDTDRVRTQFVLPFAERAAVASALSGLEHCFTFAVDRLAARVMADKGAVLQHLCARNAASGSGLCAPRDAADALLDKFRRASVGSFHRAYFPGGSSSAAGEFVKAVSLETGRELWYEGNFTTLLREAQPALRDHGFRVVFGPRGATYVVEEADGSDWLGAAGRALAALRSGADAALHARARRALCAALRKTASPLCTRA